MVFDMTDWDFKVRGIAGPKFSQWCKAGEVIVETVHRGVFSAQIEVEAWKSRMLNGEDIDHIELLIFRRVSRPGGRRSTSGH